MLLVLTMTGYSHHARAAGNAPQLNHQIDAIVARSLAERKIVPAAASSDAEFLRRVALDLTGVIPTSRMARSFLDNTAPDKRQRLIDELLTSPEYALHMARAFDVFLIERRIPAITSYDVPSPVWRSDLTQAFAENRPWDRMVRDILASDGTDPQNAAGVKFALVRDVAPHQLTRDVGRLFLGVDLQCAQCHDDPRIDAYRQSDYFGVYAFLQRMTAFRDNKKNVSLVGETAAGKATFVSVFTAKSGETDPRLPGGEMISDPMLDAGQEYVVKPTGDTRGVPTYSRRRKLAELLPRAETQGFSRNIVNRIWAMFLGRGIVHPLDLHHAGNPPTHPDLLKLLEDWFVTHQFDIKALMREIVLSQTYQRSSVLPSDVRNFPDEALAVARLRGLSPEQMSWSVLQAAGRIEQHVVQLAANQEFALAESPDEPFFWKTRLAQLEPLDRQARTLTAVFAGLPGQPDGDFQPVVDQALHLLNSPAMLTLIQDAPGTLVTRLTAMMDVELLADELYLSVLSRRPETEEIAEVRRMLVRAASTAERRTTVIALVWGLLLSSEFRLNH